MSQAELAKLRRDVKKLTELIEDVDGSLEIIWAVWIGPLYERMRRLEDHLEGATDLKLESVYTLEDAKKRHVTIVMERHSGNKMRVAKDLGVNVKTLYNMLTRWGKYVPKEKEQ